MRLTEILTKEFIIIPLKSSSRDAAIKELIDINASRVDDADKAYNAVLAREKIMTTGVGNGIAIPHCKDESCPNFTIVLGITTTGIDFSSVDSKDVTLIFLLLGPENNTVIHIKLLSRISRLMSMEEVRSKLMLCGNSQEAFTLLKQAETDFPNID